MEKSTTGKGVDRDKPQNQTIKWIGRNQIKSVGFTAITHSLSEKENGIHQISDIRKSVYGLPHDFQHIRSFAKPGIYAIFSSEFKPKTRRVQEMIKEVYNQAEHHRGPESIIDFIFIKLP